PQIEFDHNDITLSNFPARFIPNKAKVVYRPTSVFNHSLWDNFIDKTEYIAYKWFVDNYRVTINGLSLLYLGDSHKSYLNEEISYYTADISKKTLYNNTVNDKVLKIFVTIKYTDTIKTDLKADLKALLTNAYYTNN